MRIYSSLEVRAGTRLADVLDWLSVYLTAPHPSLGRGGAVCPYARPALRAGSLYLTEVRGVDAVDRHVTACRHAFTTLPGAQALVVSFPEVTAPVAPSLLGGLLDRVKQDFVRDGLMLGPVYPGNEIPGAHNPAFRPMAGPLPLVAIRRMMESDLPFLNRPADPARVRAEYVGAYLRHLAPGLSPRRRAAAERVLAELEGARP
jgi:hypothetical protein